MVLLLDFLNEHSRVVAGGSVCVSVNCECICLSSIDADKVLRNAAKQQAVY